MTTVESATTGLRARREGEPSRFQILLASVRAEWTKLRSVRSTAWSLLVTLVITIGLGALFCAARVSRWDRLDPGERLNFDPTSFSLNGLFLAQLAIGVLGVLVISSEYTTGQIRASLGAVPQRRTMLAAKVIVFSVVTFVVGLIACLSAFAIGQSIFTAKHAGVSLSDPSVLRAVIGGGLYLAVLGAFGIGLGAILRRTAGAIATLVGFLLVLPILVNFLPSPWNDDIGRYLPGQAGGAIFQVVRDSNSLGPWTGFAVFCAYAAVALVLGAVLLSRRDA
ncbi:MAG: type transport system permease protein [Acidimicrobiaceae bacterium]|jgi:ABC-type transport system involved in multi-copper enzyme maturation permease subunit|nr:type transport system permease protein [Acidimicrobiaceae bacterium]